MINDLDSLQNLLKLCRKQGVNEIKLGNVFISFGELPKKRREDEQSDGEIPTPELKGDELIFYSSGGVANENQQG